MKKLTATFLILLLCTQAVSATASAQSPQNIQTEYFDDGSYLVTTITEQPNNLSQISLFSSTNTKTKTKTVNFYNSSDKLMWYVQVKGTFTYGNGSAKCTNAQVSAQSRSSNWKISSKSARKSGNKAIASATAKFYNGIALIQTMNKTVTLTCSPTGQFS